MEAHPVLKRVLRKHKSVIFLLEIRGTKGEQQQAVRCYRILLNGTTVKEVAKQKLI